MTSTWAILILAVIVVPVLTLQIDLVHSSDEEQFESYAEPNFGIVLDRPLAWTFEGDDPWLHTTVTPWHLPLIPIKELQPTAVDILLEGRKTLLFDFIDDQNESLAIVRVSVEKMPFGKSSLDTYGMHTVQRLSNNNENVKVIEDSMTSISGNPARRLLITHGDTDARSKTLQIFTTYGNLVYVFQYDASGDAFDENLTIAQRVFDSVSISPPSSRSQILLIGLMGAGIASASIIWIKARRRDSRTVFFIIQTKRLFPMAFGIELLCVASAEIGGFLGLWYFGFNTLGIVAAYLLAYTLAGFTTFASILGRTAQNDGNEVICGCSSMTDHFHSSQMGIKAGIMQTFTNFKAGLALMPRLHELPNASKIVKASLIVLISAESGCVIAAATVDIALYGYSIFLSIPAALLCGTLTVAATSAFRSAKRQVTPDSV